jgi:hypothetical protein
MKKFIIIIIVLLLIGFLGYKYAFRAPEDVSKAVPKFTIEAVELAQEFSENIVTADSIYKNKVIEVKGSITEIDGSGYTLDEKIFCKFSEKVTAKLNDNITVKGLYIGYDDLFEVVKLDQCSMVK